MKEQRIKVDNAIILAAGLSSRFAPLSFERPKGLAVAHGERLVERQIRQLTKANIKEIIIVVGNMKEKFEYLQEKYSNVKLIENPDYKTRNTHSSLYVAREYLKNTYILCSDNYYPEGVFKEIEDVPFTSTIYLDGIQDNERGVIPDETGLIVQTELPAINKWCMLGYQLFDEKFSNTFKKLLEEVYNTPGTESLYWERVYGNNVDKLKLYEKKFAPGQILEFDTVKELAEFDPMYLENGQYEFVENICKILLCTPKEIKNFQIISKGLTNNSFSFTVNEKKYIYRFPGVDAPVKINRLLEKNNQELAKKIGIDNSYIYEDPEKGWKISEFIDVDSPFDFQNISHVKLLCNALKKFNQAHFKCGVVFDYIDKTNKIMTKIKEIDEKKHLELMHYYNNILLIEKLIKNDNWDFQLSHNDIWEDNLLIRGNEIYLIDWEYAGDTDIGYDISKLCVKSECKIEDLPNYLVNYFERIPTEDELNHLIGCTAVSYYYWTVWATYMILKGYKYDDYLNRYRNVLNQYYNLYINRNKEKEKWN